MIIIISITFIVSNQSYKVRYYDQLKVFFQPQGLDKYLKSSEYGAHYNTAYKMFQQNKIFGVGIKNYRELKHLKRNIEVMNINLVEHP